MKRKSQFCYLGSDVTTWKLLKSAGFKNGMYFTSDFFSALVVASGKEKPILAVVEFSSEEGLSVNIRTDSWGRNEQYDVRDAKLFRPVSLRLLTSEEVSAEIEKIKSKGHDFSWMLSKLDFNAG